MIRNLSARLRAISVAPEATAVCDEAAETSVWRIERRYPLSTCVGEASLADIDAASAEAVRLMQPDVTAFSPRNAVFLDTETTGLSGGVGTLAFLVGIAWLEGDVLILEQLMIRDYHEEEAMLQKVAQRIRGRTLVTYNGRSYDAPLLRSRMTMNRVSPIPDDVPHIDLLHAARRVYRMRLKKCSLVDMEKGVLDLYRVDDLPGALAPEHFFRYLRTRDEELILEVARHNEQDLLSLAALLGRMAQVVSEPSEGPQTGHRADALGIGGLYERGGDLRVAERCYRFAAGRGAASQEGKAARWALHRLYRRSKRPQEERAALLELVEARQGGVDALVALAKVCEHRLRDYPTALYAVDEAISLAVVDEIKWELVHRRERILRRMKAAK